MARKNQHTREEMRQLAIDVAEQCIIEHGVQGVKARHIAKEMGYAVGTLYQLFKNMDMLIFAVNMRSLASLRQCLQAVVDDAPNCCAAIEGMVMTYVDYALVETPRWRTLLEHTLPDDTDVPEVYDIQRKTLFALLEEQFQCAYPEMSKKSIALESRALWAGVHGICTLALANKLDDDGLAIKDIVHTLLVRFHHQGGKSCDY